VHGAKFLSSRGRPFAVTPADLKTAPRAGGQIEECHISNHIAARPKVVTTPSAGGFAIADDGSDTD
jgi:hypothetical protein